MSVEILTKDDLLQFKSELLDEIKKILSTNDGLEKKWLKATEVRQLLDISPNTLTQMRINGQLGFSKVGGIYYYSKFDIEKMLQLHKRTY